MENEINARVLVDVAPMSLAVCLPAVPLRRTFRITDVVTRPHSIGEIYDTWAGCKDAVEVSR